MGRTNGRVNQGINRNKLKLVFDDTEREALAIEQMQSYEERCVSRRESRPRVRVEHFERQTPQEELVDIMSMLSEVH